MTNVRSDGCRLIIFVVLAGGTRGISLHLLGSKRLSSIVKISDTVEGYWASKDPCDLVMGSLRSCDDLPVRVGGFAATNDSGKRCGDSGHGSARESWSLADGSPSAFNPAWLCCGPIPGTFPQRPVLPGDLNSWNCLCFELLLSLAVLVLNEISPLFANLSE